MSTTTRTTPRVTLYGSDVFTDSVLDDTEDAVFASAMTTAHERVMRTAAREEKRSRATAQRVAGKRSLADVYAPIPEEIQTFLAVHPAL